MQDASFRIDCRGRVLDALPGRALVMGVLNVTPDSFSDGARYFDDPPRALARARQMLGEGAAIVDVGGESARPAGTIYGEGAPAIPAHEEKRRVLPVVERIAAELPDAVISVDTYKAEVAAAALEAGAHMINDITGLRYDASLAHVVADYGAALVVMHSRGQPGTFEHERRVGGDVMAEVLESLEESLAAAAAAGVESVAVDPGFGFGKTPRENLRLLAATGQLLQLGRPVMVALSRKATIGLALSGTDEPAPVDQRLYGSLGATALAVSLGASIVRTHDVRETAEMLTVLTAAMEAGADVLPQPLLSQSSLSP